jgi:hypothetical protein
MARTGSVDSFQHVWFWHLADIALCEPDFRI